MLCCGYTLTDFPISIRLTSLALWQSNDCPSASKATLMNMDKYFMWIHYERLHDHNKAKHNKTVCIFLGIYCKYTCTLVSTRCKQLKTWYTEARVPFSFYEHDLTLIYTWISDHMTRNVWDENTYPFDDDVIKWKHFPRYWPCVRLVIWEAIAFIVPSL